MITGFNHNFTYQKLKLHIQTEDCGVKKPRIETHLFRDGIIVATRKTSYDDILKVDDLGRVVEELMKDQHRDMLRRLKNGDYDNILGVVRDQKDDSAAILDDLPDEVEIDQLALEALAPASTAKKGKSEPGPADTAQNADEIIEVDDFEEVIDIEELEEIEEVEELELAEVEDNEKTAEPAETVSPDLEELVLKYFLGESGKGLKSQVF